MRRVLVVSLLVTACGGNTPPPKQEPPPHLQGLSDSPLGGGSAAPVAALPPEDAGAPAAKNTPAPAANELPADVIAVARSQGSAGALALDATHVYWIAEKDGTLSRAPKKGGIPLMLHSGSPLSGASFLALDADSVYFTSQEAKGKEIGRVEKGSGKKATVRANGDEVKAIATDANNVYFAVGLSIMRWAKPSGPEAALAMKQNDPVSVASDGTNVFYTNFGTAGGGYKEGAVIRVAAKGGNAQVIAPDQPKATLVTVEGDQVYWLSDKKLMRAPKNGGAAQPVADAENASWLSVDGTHVYFAAGNSVMRAPKDGSGKAEPFVQLPGKVHAVVADTDAVYFTFKGTEEKQLRDGAVLKKAK
jgi:hypothetical protein